MYYQDVESTFQYLDKLPKGDLIEFGVFNGNTMNRLIKGAEAANNPFLTVHGFDSFIGLPDEAKGVYDNSIEWPRGAFSVSNDYNLNSIEEAIKFVQTRIDRKDINFYPGFFSESLTEELGKKLTNSASYIHIDVDIFLSTWQVLDWIFTYDIIKKGGILRMDDWASVPEYKGGNSLAWIDSQRKFRFSANRLSMNVFQYLG